MPSSLSTDIAHTEVTDHRIRRRPALSPELLQDTIPERSSLRLIPYPYSTEAGDDVRDLALAWESLAENGVPEAASQADRLLRLAAKQSPEDPAILSRLAYVELKHRAIEHARELYQKALALDPTLIDAAANLGAIEAGSGRPRSAVRLWQGAFERAPGKSSIGMNLARLFCEAGQMEEARSYVLRVLQFAPDMDAAKKMLQRLNGPSPRCQP
jgi:Flp pilus assembly protein TadD